MSTLSSAAEIQAVDGSGVILRSVPTSRGDFRQAEYCDSQGCQKYPSDDVVLAMSFGGTVSWEEIFHQCGNFESLNDFVFYTEIVSSIALFAKPATVLRNLRSTKNLLTSWGLAGRVAGNRFVFDSGVVIAGDTVFSLPKTLLDSGSPYPQVSEEDVRIVSALAEGMLSDGNEVFFLPQDLVRGLSVVVSSCTSQLENNVVEMGYQKSIQEFNRRRQEEKARLKTGKHLEINFGF